MYRVSPFTYLVSGVLSTGLANTAVVCADIEYLHFNPPSGETCASYMKPYISSFGGYLESSTLNATSIPCVCSPDENTALTCTSLAYGFFDQAHVLGCGLE